MSIPTINLSLPLPYGVDVKQGNELVDIIKSFIPLVGGFCAEYEYKGIQLAASADGCGTKLDLANTYK